MKFSLFVLSGIISLGCMICLNCTKDNPVAPVKPIVKLLSPLGGEIFFVGDTMHIRWDANTDSVQAMSIDISFNGSLTYKTLPGVPGTNDSNWMDYHWIIPDSLFSISTVSDSCLIRARKYDNLNPSSTSESFFTILPRRALRFNSPKTGETFFVDDTMHIRWSTNRWYIDPDSTPPVSVAMTFDGVQTQLNTTLLPVTSGTTIGADSNWVDVVWVIPDSLNSLLTVGDSCIVTIQSHDPHLRTLECNTLVSVKPRRALRLISPLGGETFHVGDTMHIRWKTNLDSMAQAVVIELVWGPYIKSLPAVTNDNWENDSWVITDSLYHVSTISDSCIIRVRGYQVQSIFSVESASYLSIKPRM